MSSENLTWTDCSDLRSAWKLDPGLGSWFWFWFWAAASALCDEDVVHEHVHAFYLPSEDRKAGRLNLPQASAGDAFRSSAVTQTLRRQRFHAGLMPSIVRVPAMCPPVPCPSMKQAALR